jgi:alkylation response protein AidB-like acyl-CoA dehydrogenase
MMVAVSGPLAPVTEAGRAAWRLAATHADAFAAQAGDRDRRGRFDPGAVAEMRASGFAGACVPLSCGGLGVDQLRDVMALACRLGRGDGSLALAAHMHLSGTWGLARAAAKGLGGAELGPLLHRVAAGEVWLSAAVTEAGTNYFHPAARLQARGEGWMLEGTKVFATGSPAATHLSTNARVVGGPFDGRLANVIVPVDRDGVEVVDDWDGLGMRASGSGQVRFRGCPLGPETIVLPAGPWGRFTAAALQGRAFGNVGNVSVMLGIAEAARDLAVARARRDGRVSSTPLAERATVRHGLAEVEVELLTARAVLARLGERADALAAAPSDDLEVAHRFMADFQAAKLAVNRLAASVVDRSLALGGGAAYGGGHPIARLVRDVRAGQFMQPFSPHEALGYVGAVVAGIEPDVEA